MANDLPEGFRYVDAPKDTPKGDKLSPVVGGIADTVGLTDRPGARTVADVALRPGQGLDNGGAFGGWQGSMERVAQAAMSAAPIMKAGTLAAKVLPKAVSAVAPAAGRIAASGAKGAGEAAYQAEDGGALGAAGWGALIDAATAGAFEAGAGVLGNVGVNLGRGRLKLGLKEWGAPVRAFDWATAAPAKALEMVRSRLPAGKWLNVPSLDSAKLTAQEAIERLANMVGPKYQQARAEIVHELNRLDAQKLTGPKPLAGSVVAKNTAKDRFPPSGQAKLAEGARGVIGNESARAAVDAAATQDLEGGVPVGALAIPAAQGFGSVARKLTPF